MKRRFLAVALTCAMTISMLAGCGAKEVSSLDGTADQAAGQVESTITPTEAPSKDDTAVGGFDETPVVEPTTEPTETPVEPTTPEVPVVVGDYTIEKIEQSIPTENLMVSITGSQDGSSFLMEVGSHENDFVFVIKAENAEHEMFTEMSFYTVGGSIYSKQSDGSNIVYKKAVLSEPNVEGSGMAMSAEDSMGVDFETVVGVEYLRTETIDGFNYDVVRVDTETYPEGAFVPAEGVVVTDPETGEVIEAPEPVIEPLFFYINTDTKMCEFFLASDVASGVDNGDSRVDFYVLSEVVLPDDFATATLTEVPEQELAMDMFGSIFMMSAVMSGMDMSEDVGEIPMNTPSTDGTVTE